MRTITATEARKQLFQILKEGKRVEIQHPKNSMVLLAKEELDALETELLMKEMDEALAQPHKWYTSEQVDAMLAEVLKRKQERDSKDAILPHMGLFKRIFNNESLEEI